MKIAICSFAAVLIVVSLLLFVRLNDNPPSPAEISGQNDCQDSYIIQDHMIQEAVADGAQCYSLTDKDDRKYNMFFVVRRDYPDKYSIRANFWFDAKYAVASRDFLFYVKNIPSDKNRPESIKLYYGVSGCSATVTFEPQRQDTAWIKAADSRLSWGKFFGKTTTSPDGKTTSPWNELIAGESGYFLFPRFSREPVSPENFDKIIALIKESEWNLYD